jgi:hypothetical protein
MFQWNLNVENRNPYVLHRYFKYPYFAEVIIHGKHKRGQILITYQITIIDKQEVNLKLCHRPD